MTGELAGGQVVIELLYLIASVLFILSLKWMSSPTTARHGIWAGEAGMLLAICIGIAVAYGLHPGFIAIASAAVGWIIAERNALRSRISQWPIMRNYIDWQRVRADLPRDF